MTNIQIILNSQTPKIDFIENVNDWIEKNVELINDFIKFCHSNPKAIGVAANQVSLNGTRLAARFFCYKTIDAKISQWNCIINPKIISYVGNYEEVKEKCLTWPNKTIIAKRYPQLLVSYWDNNKTFHNNIIIKNFEAQVWQHEIDHLNGTEEILIEANENTIKRETPKIGRNEVCYCGSGKKFKKCCLLK